MVLQVTAAQGCRVVWSAEKGHVGPLYGVDYNNDWHVAAVDGNTSSDVEVQQEGLALRHLPLVQQQHHQTRQERIDSFVLPPYTEPQLHKFEENNISNNGNSTLHIEEDEGGEESEDDEEEAGQDEDGEDIIIMENLLRRRDRLEQQLEGQIQRRQRFLHETNITNTLVPMTLSLNSHILVTNGRSNNELSVWDITSEGGRHLYNLSHSFPKRFNNNSTTTAISHQKEVMRDLPFAELAKDGSMIYSCLEQDIDMDNLVSISHGTMMPGGGGALTDEELMEQQQQHLLQRRRQQSATFVWWDFNPNSCSDATSTTTNSTAAVPLLQSQGRQQHQQKSSVINQDLSLVSRPRQRRFQKFFTSLHENSIDFWLCWEEM